MQDDYICDLSQFKLDTSVAKEMSSFLSGFWKVCVLIMTSIYPNIQWMGFCFLCVHMFCSNIQWMGFNLCCVRTHVLCIAIVRTYVIFRPCFKYLGWHVNIVGREVPIM